MAFGIDDFITAATKGITLADTIVQIVKRYHHEKKDRDLEMLLQEVRLTALRRIDEADTALTQFERTLQQREIDTRKRLIDVIKETSFWHPFEQHRLSQLQKQFSLFSDSIASACDDIAALVRCQQRTGTMGQAIVESAWAKQALSEKVLHAGSVKEAIDLLRGALRDQRASLTP